MPEILQTGEPWLEIFPIGVSFEAAEFASPNRPVMFFKDKRDKYCLPVWLSPIDAGIVISQEPGRRPASTPHKMALKIISKLGLTVTSCVFTELKGHYQNVRVFFSGENLKLQYIDARADEVISFCLSAKAKFYCRNSFINDCKVMDASISPLPGNIQLASRISANLRPKYLN